MIDETRAPRIYGLFDRFIPSVEIPLAAGMPNVDSSMHDYWLLDNTTKMYN